MRSQRVAAPFLVAAVALAACTGTPAQSTGSASASAAPASTLPPSATPAATTAPSPTMTPSPEPLVIDWTREPATGLDKATTDITDVVAGDGQLVMAATVFRDEDYRSVMYHSTDGTTWEPASSQPDMERVWDVAAGRPGFVAVGGVDDDAGVWLSTDGDTWERVQDDSLKHGTAQILLVTESGLIAFGQRTDDSDQRMIWTSEDGLEWLAATNETGRQVASGLLAATDYDGRALAFVQAVENGPITAWETTGRADWTQVGELPDSADALVDSAAGGPRGWVAVGSANENGLPAAWASDDGRTWRAAGTGPDVSSDLVADDAGFVAVGYVGSLPGETCGDQRPFAMKTWTSVDGDAWTLQPSGEDALASVLQAVAVDRTLVGLGIDWDKGDFSSGSGQATRWTSPLPPVAAPARTSDKPTTPKTCGP